MIILTSDCRELMPSHGPFDMILADPPYGETSLARDRRVEGWIALARAALADRLDLGLRLAAQLRGDRSTVR